MMDWFCNVCDKTIKRNSITRHIMSKSHLVLKSKEYFEKTRQVKTTTGIFFPLNETLSNL